MMAPLRVLQQQHDFITIIAELISLSNQLSNETKRLDVTRMHTEMTAHIIDLK